MKPIKPPVPQQLAVEVAYICSQWSNIQCIRQDDYWWQVFRGVRRLVVVRSLQP